MIERPYRRSLRGKIINRALVIGLLPLLILGAVGYFGLTNLLNTTQQGINVSRDRMLDEVVGANLTSTARNIAGQLDTFLLERISDAVSWATAPTVISAARNAAADHLERGITGLDIDSVENLFSDRKSLGLYPDADNYLRAQVEDSIHFGEIFFTDVNGYNVSLTNPTSDFVQSDEDWWQEAFQNGISVGQVEYDDSAGIWSVEISVRISDANDNHYGVMKAVLGVSLIQEVSDAGAEAISEGQITVVDTTGMLLAETSSDHAASRIMNESINLKNARDEAAQLIFGGLPGGYALGSQQVIGFAKSAPGSFYDAEVAGFPGFDWTVVVEQPTAVAFAPIQELTRVQETLSASRIRLLIVLAVAFVVVAALAIYASNLLANNIIGPIRQLQQLAENVSKGNTRQTVEVNSDDEIQDLAHIFDRMRSSIAILVRRYEQLRTQQGS